jgi:hypothetical protein
LANLDTTSGFFVEVSYKALLSASFGFLFVHPEFKERSWHYLVLRSCNAVSSSNTGGGGGSSGGCGLFPSFSPIGFDE